MSHVALFLLLWASCSAYALWRGGAPERVAAGIIIAGVAASAVAASGPGHRWNDVELGLLLVDGLMLAGFIVLIVRANRLWPIAMTALMIVQVTGHLLKGLDPQLYPFLYWMTSSIWSYLVVLLQVPAVWLHQKRLRTHGHDVSWNNSSAPLPMGTPASSRGD